MPKGDGLLRISTGYSTTSRHGAIEYFCANSTAGTEYYIGKLDSDISTVTWYQVSTSAVSTTALAARAEDVEPI